MSFWSLVYISISVHRSAWARCLLLPLQISCLPFSAWSHSIVGPVGAHQPASCPPASASFQPMERPRRWSERKGQWGQTFFLPTFLSASSPWLGFLFRRRSITSQGSLLSITLLLDSRIFLSPCIEGLEVISDPPLPGLDFSTLPCVPQFCKQALGEWSVPSISCWDPHWDSALHGVTNLIPSPLLWSKHK